MYLAHTGFPEIEPEWSVWAEYTTSLRVSTSNRRTETGLSWKIKIGYLGVKKYRSCSGLGESGGWSCTGLVAGRLVL